MWGCCLLPACTVGSDDKVFLGVDDEPVSKKEICASALASGSYPDCPVPQFAIQHGPRGKTCDNTWTRGRLQWTPQYASFRAYMRCTLGGASPASLVGQAQDRAKAQERRSALWLPGDGDGFDEL